ncbi:ATP-binding protein [Candidatus Bipolaricaulota bacterium]|nr:ATP-binding protein [Candidatus Bipolaricaulota bacterium]
MLPRTLEPVIRQAAQRYPVVTLTGPRQSGKTTLARMAFPDYAYASLEDPDQRGFATTDPRGFLSQFDGSVILDEAQRVPDLFSYIQTRADASGRNGQYILTGSQSFLLMKTISQSLAGRAAILHLLPFSQAELHGQPPLPRDSIGQRMPPARVSEKRSLMDTLFTGGYPRIHDKELPPQEWLANYYRTYVERDVRELLNIGDLEAFGRFIGLCAGRTGQLLNLSSLGNDCGISQPTARRWLSVLEASFLVFLLRPHHRNFNKRLVKSPKLYFLDSGLLTYLLRIRSPDELRTHSARGAIFESFVVSELVKSALHHGQEPDLYFWRDSTGHEVDILLERGSEVVPIEVKSGETLASDFYVGLQYWLALAQTPTGPAALVYGGDQTVRRSGIITYSWADL